MQSATCQRANGLLLRLCFCAPRAAILSCLAQLLKKLSSSLPNGYELPYHLARAHTSHNLQKACARYPLYVAARSAHYPLHVVRMENCACVNVPTFQTKTLNGQSRKYGRDSPHQHARDNVAILD